MISLLRLLTTFRLLWIVQTIKTKKMASGINQIAFLAIVSILNFQITEQWENDPVTTQIFTGTIFDPIPLIPYEASIPLTFQIPIKLNLTNITNFDNNRPCQQDPRSQTC